jgi:hypothetical protein
VKVFDSNVRLSIGLRKQRDEWPFAHEHHSYPIELKRHLEMMVARVYAVISTAQIEKAEEWYSGLFGRVQAIRC